MKIKIKKNKNKEKIPYSKRSDLQKIRGSWVKAKALLGKGECSSSILRAATACELAANFVVRKALCEDIKLKKEFVNSLLLWANGLQGKFTRLIAPLFKSKQQFERFKKINTKIKSINSERNSIIHQGQFKGKRTADKVLGDSYIVINILVRTYAPGFMLRGHRVEK